MPYPSRLRINQPKASRQGGICNACPSGCRPFAKTVTTQGQRRINRLTRRDRVVGLLRPAVAELQEAQEAVQSILMATCSIREVASRGVYRRW